ncbi:MAG: glycosyltransferase family 4 protein [Actinomycetia bacterium]|nr:glycosyltransferase family 4 protein [Actinomycetes bacterium]
MRLLFLCPHFTPDLHAATGEVMTKLVEGLADRGHEANVVTALPWYKGHRVDPEWKGRPWRVERTEWGKVVRVWPFPTDKTNIAARALGFGGFTALASAAALALGRHDAVLAMSPPIVLGDAGLLAARRWRVPFVLNVQDIFPDVAVDLGALSNPRVIAAAERHERRLYRLADAVTVLSQDQADNVTAKLDLDGSDRGSTGQKVHIIQNFVDRDRIQVVDKNNDYRRRHDLGHKTVVMYSGNVGLSQSFDLIRVAAEQWQLRSDIQFVINGEGAARPEVDRWASALDNVTVVDFAPRDQVSQVLGAADVQLILLKRGLARSSTPSKMYANLAAGRPVLASIDEGSEVATTLAAAGAGVSVPPEDHDAFQKALGAMVDDPSRLETMGRDARAYVERCMTPQEQAERYESLFATLVGSPNGLSVTTRVTESQRRE